MSQNGYVSVNYIMPEGRSWGGHCSEIYSNLKTFKTKMFLGIIVFVAGFWQSYFESCSPCAGWAVNLSTGVGLWL